MARIVITEFVSLDGVVEDPGGSESFRYGGWSFEFDRGPEHHVHAPVDDLPGGGCKICHLAERL